MPSGRLGAVVAATLTAILVLSVIGPAVSAAKAPAGLKQFMYAVGKVESGGNYYARNPYSGAYGKYQIMPSNWPSWARTYLGNANAKQTPANQEKVAAGKFTALYRSLDSWRRVAYWWLTGSKSTAGWSTYATRYVNKVMRLYKQGGGNTEAKKPAGKHFGETAKAVAYAGSWKLADHRGYAGDKVRYATKAGASATLTFTGRKVTWYGPVGPTRGKARVFVDGTYVKTVDLYRRSFDVRAAVFRTGWSKPGAHTLTIKVVGTKGHPMVAIDEFVVAP
ncbi:MAG: transglycosylase SLT domain-containing protein [Candidatus Limnocylindrales bacterium]